MEYLAGGGLAVQRSRRPWRPRADSQSGGSCVPGHRRRRNRASQDRARYFDGTSNPGPSQGGAFWILLSGMACVRPTSATRCWRIRATSARTRKVRPGRAACRASHLLGGRSLSTFIRSLHHVKVVYQPGEGLEAKAYLAVNHHWHTPAPGAKIMKHRSQPVLAKSRCRPARALCNVVCGARAV